MKDGAVMALDLSDALQLFLLPLLLLPLLLCSVNILNTHDSF